MRTTRRYFACCTSRTISTTMVFSIFALVTLPVSTVRSPRVSCAAPCVSVAIMLSSIPVRATASLPAPNPFLTRAAASGLPLVRWSAESGGGKSARSALCAGPQALPCPPRGSFQCAAACLESSRAGDESRGNGQLVRCQSERFPRRRFVNSRHLKQDASGFHDRHPAFRSAFALAHAGFRGLLGERLVRKNANPQFAAALDEARNGHARSFNLAVGDPGVFERLQPVFAKRQISAAPGLTFT